MGRPTERTPARAAANAKYINLHCEGCVPPWEILEVDYRSPPWSLPAGVRFICPACGGEVDMREHGPPWRPIYDARSGGGHPTGNCRPSSPMLMSCELHASNDQVSHFSRGFYREQLIQLLDELNIGLLLDSPAKGSVNLLISLALPTGFEPVFQP